MKRLSGITIIELLISLVIGAAMLTLLAPMLRNAGTGLRQAQAQAEQVQFVTLRGHIRRSFRGIESSGETPLSFVGNPSQMAFFSAFSPAAIPDAIGQRVTVTIQSGTLQAVFEPIDASGVSIGSAQTFSTPFGPDVDLQIRYLPACTSTGWITEWEETRAPRAVEILGEHPRWPLFLIDRPMRLDEVC